MDELSQFLFYLRVNHLLTPSESKVRTVVSDAAKQNGKRKEKDKVFVDPLADSLKSLLDFADALKHNGTFLKNGDLLLKFKGSLPIEKMNKAEELHLFFSSQRKIFRKYMPGFTSDQELMLRLLGDLESLQDEAVASTMAGTVIPGDDANELRRINLFLAAILDNIPDMVFVKDAIHLRFVRFNKAGERLLGLTTADMLKKNDYDFFPKKQADFFTAKDRAVLASGKLLNIPEEPIQTKEQGERWLHTKKIPILGEDGKPAYLLGISEDITENKNKENAILELNKELEAFSYSISHDLRAPLRAINGYAQILEEDHAKIMDEDARRLLESIKANATKMGHLIDELLSFSRLGRKEIVKSKVDMTELIEGIMRELSAAYPYRAKLKFDHLIPVKADFGLMHQVLSNLLLNALKYSSKKENPQIEIHSRQEGGHVIYDIKDNGAGFNMQYSDKLFGVFQRLHRPDEFEGVGVGLAIVKRIINRHRGQIWAIGDTGVGATFSFSLPVK
jgi:PAS domain S-box-containing protein